MVILNQDGHSGTKRQGIQMEELKNPFKYPKNGDWIWNAKNMHIMNWVLNVRKERRMQKEERELIIIDIRKITQKLWDLVATAYAHKKNSAQIYQIEWKACTI